MPTLAQQTPVLDKLHRPLHDLRISVTDRCNFRCSYCMPKEIFGEGYEFTPAADLLSFEEITRLAQIFARLGAVKLRLTGGEPLVRPQLHRLVGMLSGIPGVEDLTMTTNGYLLAAQAKALREAGLRRITVSLDSLDDGVFGKMNGLGLPASRVLKGIEAAVAAGLDPIKVNCVVQRGVNDHTLADLARHFKGTGIILRFIEFMDVGNRNGWKMDQVVPAAEIVRRISAELPLEPAEANYFGEVASRYRYLDGSGEVGVIESVTQPFCAECTRARLSPQGQLFTCLFGVKGRDLRAPLRAGATDDDLAALISDVWQARTDRYSELRASLSTPRTHKVEMFHIGG